MQSNSKTPDNKPTRTGVRINKYLADNGLASRREGDELIVAKKVFINGKPAKLGDMVQPTDNVEVKNRTAVPYQYFLYNKPRGVVTVNAVRTTKMKEKEIKDLVRIPNGVVPVGRLDKESEGLLLLTNDRRVPKRLLEPQFDHEKEYEVTVDKAITQTFLNALSRGVQLEEFKTKPAQVKWITNTSFRITLTEGKHHQVRRMCDKFGYSVRQLVRVRLLSFKIDHVPANILQPLTLKQKESLLEQLGLK